MKRIFSLLVLFCFMCAATSAYPLNTFANDETVLTLEVPGTDSISFSGSKDEDAFGLAVGYQLADDCVGLSGYAVTVKWDPNVLMLNTDYVDGMTDDEMASCEGCYFEDLYDAGLAVAPAGMFVVNYRNVRKGELTVVSVSLQDMPYREATLFVLDMIPLCDNIETEVQVKVKEIFGLTSSEGPIEEYRKQTVTTFKIGTPVRYGDIDGNGTVDSADMLAIKRHALGEKLLVDTPLIRADLDNNSFINGKDYLLLCRELQK